MQFSRSGGRLGLLARASATLGVAIAAPTMGHSAEQGLVLTGYNASYSSGMPMETEGGVSSKTLCGPDGISALQKANQAVLERLSSRIADPGIPTPGEREEHARTIRTELCQGEGGFDLQSTVITYSACRMTMDQQSIMTDMRLPGADGEGAMEVADFWKAEVMRVPLYPADASAKTANTRQRASGINWTGPGDTRLIAGYPATRWDFQYSSDMGMGGAMAGMSVSITTGNLTQSVQKHLQALGYDTGNTDGELSTETIIAISQFQAEKGMQATGEVTPQLLGILGAEVDSR